MMAAKLRGHTSCWLLTVFMLGSLAGPAGAALYIAPLGPGNTWQVYETVSSSLLWTDAQAAAQAKIDPLFGTTVTGNLFAINSAAENLFAQRMVRGAGSWWIGGTDQTVEGEWRWINDGTQFWQGAASGSAVGGNYTNWNTNEPNNSGDEDFIEYIGSTGRWNDNGAAATRTYIIEYDTGLTVIPATTGTLILNPATGTYYERDTVSRTWTDAKAFAESRSLLGVQGKLAQVDSREENFFLAGLAGWIGLSDDEWFGGSESIGTVNPAIDGWVWSGPADTNGNFATHPLASTGYTNWNSGEPNGTAEDAGELQSSGGWNDLPSNSALHLRNALVEYETGPVAPLNFQVAVLNDAATGTGSQNEARRLFNGMRTAIGPAFTGQYAAINFSDPQGASGGSVGGNTIFPNDATADENNFALKAVASVVIPEAGTYTFGVNHDDAIELIIERGADAVLAWSQSGTGGQIQTTTFSQPGTYQVTLLLGESTGGAGVELIAAQGSFADYATLVAGGGRLVGDIINGGLATSAPSDLRVANGFTVRDVKAASGVTLNNIVDGISLLDGGLSSSSEATAVFATVNFRDDVETPVGNFGNEHFFPNGVDGIADDNFAIRATADLIVGADDEGWWTFGVSSDDGFRLGIEGRDFTTWAGATGTSIVDGQLQYHDPRGTTDSFGHVYLEPGVYDLTLEFFERGGGANVELYYSAGVHSAFNGSFALLTPEPTSAMLLLLGGLMLLGAGRPRRQAAR